MKLQRWLQGRAELQADRTESSTKDADIQRELKRFDAEFAAIRAEIAALKSVNSPGFGRLAKEVPGAPEAAVGEAMGGRASDRTLTTPAVPPMRWDNFARVVRTAAPVRGRAGGLAQARDAWRYSDGTFMSSGEREAAIAEQEIETYERYAAGGRARAARAARNTDGTFQTNKRGNLVG